MKVTEGELEARKSLVTTADFCWDGSEWFYRSMDEMPASFMMKNFKSVKYPLRKQKPWESMEKQQKTWYFYSYGQ